MISVRESEPNDRVSRPTLRSVRVPWESKPLSRRAPRLHRLHHWVRCPDRPNTLPIARRPPRRPASCCSEPLSTFSPRSVRPRFAKSLPRRRTSADYSAPFLPLRIRARRTARKWKGPSRCGSSPSSVPASADRSLFHIPDAPKTKIVVPVVRFVPVPVRGPQVVCFIVETGAPHALAARPVGT